MFQTKVTFAVGQTPAQRKAHAAYWRREDARRREINNGLDFWRVCGKPRCRRNHTCSDDMHACFARLWPQVPQEEKEYWRGCITAARDGDHPSTDAIHRAGLAARDKYLNEVERSIAAPAPAAEARPAPDARIRRL
jgi:hypothetical protein